MSDDDWDSLIEIYNALRPFYRTTKDLEGHAGEGHHGSLWEWLPTIEALQTLTGKAREEAAASKGRKHPLTVAYQNAWQKLHKYWLKSDESHCLYAAATLFCPMTKKHYFDKNWSDTEQMQWKEQMLATVKKYWQEHYTITDSVDDETTMIDPSPLALQLGISSIKSNTPFEAYISSPPVIYTSGQRDIDILAWWATVGDPRLRQFAYDLLSIPAMSAEVERLFSSSKLSLAPQRRRMTDEMLEKLELLRYWYRNECVIYESDNCASDSENDSDDDTMEDA